MTDEALAEHRIRYGDDVTADEVFFSLYGTLHSPEYRERFAADLKKMLPRIPAVRDFRAFADAGRALADLHLGYASYRVEKMRYARTGGALDRGTVIYNSGITVSGIPPEAHEYRLGSRSGIDWILERYQVKTDTASGIRNDPNDWAEEHGDPRYILDLLARIVTVSVETVRIVRVLPPLDVVDG